VPASSALWGVKTTVATMTSDSVHNDPLLAKLILSIMPESQEDKRQNFSLESCTVSNLYHFLMIPDPLENLYIFEKKGKDLN